MGDVISLADRKAKSKVISTQKDQLKPVDRQDIPLAERIERIKNSISRINMLMEEIKQNGSR